MMAFPSNMPCHSYGTTLSGLVFLLRQGLSIPSILRPRLIVKFTQATLMRALSTSLPETTSQDLPTAMTETEEASEVPGGDEVQVFAPANALPAGSEAAAVQPVIGISQRVRVNSKEKKDLGTLGMTAPPLSL